MAFSYHSKTPCLAFVNIYKYSFGFALLSEGWVFFRFLFLKKTCGVFFFGFAGVFFFVLW